MLTGLNHLTLSTRDVAESVRFYTEVLGCKLLARWSRGAYLLAGDVWLALSLDPSTRSEALPEYTHVAFSVEPGQFEAVAARIRASGAHIFKDNTSEGASLYFLDPNGHKLEIHATDLQARLQSLREAPYDGLELFV